MGKSSSPEYQPGCITYLPRQPVFDVLLGSMETLAPNPIPALQELPVWPGEAEPLTTVFCFPSAHSDSIVPDQESLPSFLQGPPGT